MPRSRDSERFARVYDDEVFNVFGFFAYRLNSRADAEDLTQHTFERALRAWDRYDPERASVGTWLISIARNLLIDHYRRDRSSSQESIDEHPPEGLPSTPGIDAAGFDLAPDLALALERLGQRERELIALRYGADMTGPEIAELTGLTLANVQQILSRSLRRMRAELESYAESGPTPARPTAATASRAETGPGVGANQQPYAAQTPAVVHDRRRGAGAGRRETRAAAPAARPRGGGRSRPARGPGTRSSAHFLRSVNRKSGNGG